MDSKVQNKNNLGLFLITLPNTRKNNFALLCFLVWRTDLVNTVEEDIPIDILIIFLRVISIRSGVFGPKV